MNPPGRRWTVRERIAAFLTDLVLAVGILFVTALIVPLLLAALPNINATDFFRRNDWGRLIIALLPYALAVWYLSRWWTRDVTIGMKAFDLRR